MQQARDQWERHLGAGEVCLDFANTCDWHASPEPVEMLDRYADLAHWGLAAGVLSEGQASRLIAEAERAPEAAARALDRAVELREAIYRVFSKAAASDEPSAADLGLINQTLADSLPHARVVAADHGYAWGWEDEDLELDRVLWPVVRSAADLLTSEALDRVGECADDRGCGWLFLDTSRNRSRRWCSMESCGNRAKAARYQSREKRASGS